MEALKTILYFSIFDHPLKQEEIISFSHASQRDLVIAQLSKLVELGIVVKTKGYYIFDNDESIILKRVSGSKMAAEVKGKALKRAKIIYNFPFVKGVAFSGSYSKDYFDEDSDIDFFIITKKNRLWIARTFLILYKKIFLLNSRKFFCLNYFISENELSIPERNRFTATELVTLKPAIGKEMFDAFYNQNEWAYEYFPNFGKNANHVKIDEEKRRSTFSKLIEKLLDNFLGDKIDYFFRFLTVRKWMTKFSDMEKEQFNIALKSTRNVSKHHPQNFQKKVIDLLNNRYIDVCKKHKLNLEEEYA